MRLLISRASAEEELARLLADGHRCRSEFAKSREKTTIDAWYRQALESLAAMFPTDLEVQLFKAQPPRMAVDHIGVSREQGELLQRMHELLQALESILTTHLPRYTDLPLQERLYIEDIDSFRKVRDVNPDVVQPLLSANGYFDRPEEQIQLSLERVLNVPFHKRDWGGEINDLYTTNTLVNGRRVASAFLLKGNGLRKNVLEIADCGKNGDQILRLFESPAELFVVQFVGTVSESVIRDVSGKVRELRARDRDAHFCVMTGQDTARVLVAYNEEKLPH